MSHSQQRFFIESVRNKLPQYFSNTNVVEIGSLNINGTVRDFFNKCVHIGIDVGPGPCVDVVCLGHQYDMPNGTFDVGISCECFEHDQYWNLTFDNIIRLVKQNGLIIFSCATTGRKEHGTINNEPQSSPLTVENGWSYYRNLTEQDFKEKFNFDKLFSEYQFSSDNFACDLYFWGIKK